MNRPRTKLVGTKTSKTNHSENTKYKKKKINNLTNVKSILLMRKKRRTLHLRLLTLKQFSSLWRMYHINAMNVNMQKKMRQNKIEKNTYVEE